MSLLDRTNYFVKERVGFFKAANAYDLMDDNGNNIGVVQEIVPNFLIKMLKFTDYKPMLPFTVWFSEMDERKLFFIKRGFTIFMSKITVHDEDGRLLGSFKQKFALLKFKFEVYDASSSLVANLLGDWKGWDFKLVDKSGNEFLKITKKWAGLGRELFTSADNYIIAFNETRKFTLDEKKLFLSAAITVDMVLKESNR
ncbi:MAG: RNAase [Candidatus Coatesbacteria bacterium]|nr:RNAase [Candidatus Coatesbacteria bacterium]